ncbi:MAG: SH3 domain-containing protein [Spirochaetaceae bacterium]|jgi:uncharacterized protein YgiM (DUF1202 family)|nr:SH3 domain-containing protein [Spirochaetaceae bacterium]
MKLNDALLDVVDAIIEGERNEQQKGVYDTVRGLHKKLVSDYNGARQRHMIQFFAKDKDSSIRRCVDAGVSNNLGFSQLYSLEKEIRTALADLDGQIKLAEPQATVVTETKQGQISGKLKRPCMVLLSLAVDIAVLFFCVNWAWFLNAFGMGGKIPGFGVLIGAFAILAAIIAFLVTVLWSSIHYVLFFGSMGALCGLLGLLGVFIILLRSGLHGVGTIILMIVILAVTGSVGGLAGGKAGELVNAGITKIIPLGYNRKGKVLPVIVPLICLAVLGYSAWKFVPGVVSGVVNIKDFIVAETGGNAPKPKGSAGPTATVTSDALNVRGGPGVDNPVITQVKKGDVLTVTGDKQNGWLPVEFNGKRGFVSSEMVQINTKN